MEKANQKLQSLLAFWHEKRETREMPSRAAFTFTILRPWLDSLALIDVQSIGGVVFDACGARLRTRLGGEMAGRKISDLDDEVAGQLLHHIERARITRKPSEAAHKGTIGGIATVFHDLYLPLAEDGAHMDALLFASYPRKCVGSNVSNIKDPVV